MGFLKYVVYALLIIFAIALYMVYTAYMQIKNESEKEEKIDLEKTPYRRKHLLTKHEWQFYKNLKDIADKLNLCVLAKVRLADLIEVSAEADAKEKRTYLNKIKSKHIDFMLCRKENLFPELIIELNDSSHKKEDRVKRDIFVEKVLEKTGYKIIFVYGSDDLEKQISEKLTNKDSSNEANQEIELTGV